MAIFPCEGTLKELRTVLLNAEAETASGVSPRVDLFPHIRQLGDLVRKNRLQIACCGFGRKSCQILES